MADRVITCEFCQLTQVNPKKEDGWQMQRFKLNERYFDAMSCSQCKQLDPKTLWKIYNHNMFINHDTDGRLN